MRVLLGAAMVAVGITHFVNPMPFVRIMPPTLPSPQLMVLVSGGFEIALGLLLLIPRTRRLAGFGLVALYLAVFPANIHMALNHIQLNPEHPMPGWVAWARLPFQVVFIMLALWVSLPDPVPKRERRTIR
jgi:uncharacterized membrane protein